ncbi:MAG TPA: glycosyltransferase family 39 protein [Solirubrobacteraceae bacterium]|nr:glycosyltransferase family 39 protein [Solirubrobacteraceae bacterium]
MSTAEFPATRGRELLSLWWKERVRPVPWEVWCLLGLIAVATAIRILVINNQSIWTDEALTAYEARLPFGSMVHVVLNIETTPPLYFGLIWVWAKIFGASVIALRSVSVIAGILLVPLAYQCGRELVSRRVGLLAAAFVTVNPFLIWYSQEARSYMLLTALCGASFLWFLRARRDPSRRHVVVWVVFSALALMTHFFAGFLVAGEALWLLWLNRGRLMLVAAAVLAVVQVAMIPFAASDAAHGTDWVAQIPLHNRVGNAIAEWGVSIMFRRTPITTMFGVGALLVALIALFVLVGGDRRTKTAARLLAFMVAFVWLVPIALKVVHEDFFLSRNVMPAIVPAAVLLAAACLAPRTRVFGGVLAAVLLGLFCWSAIRVQTHPYLERPNWRSVADAIGPAAAPRVILAANGTTADPLKIYLPHALWSEPLYRKMPVQEIYVVGAIKRLALLAPTSKADVARFGRRRRRTPMGAPLPARFAPPGAVLVRRFPLHSWVVAQFELLRPTRLNYVQVYAMAYRFFHHTPRDLLVIFQRPGR